MAFIPYGRQVVTEEDISAVSAVLRSDFLTCGPKVEEFERGFADRVGSKYAVAVNSATSALHLAMRVAKVRRGDRVVTSPITFLASANAAAYVGAIPDFCDIDPVSYTIDPHRLEETWSSDTRAVVSVDYAGQASALPKIAQIARARGAVVIEDACHGVGGGFQDQANPGPVWKLGGNPWADMAVFSFHPVKSMTTGEGGMIVTDNPVFAETARVLRSHGMVRDAAKFERAGRPPILEEIGPWFYEMQELGYNYRLTDIQCALGISQLKRLDSFVARRRRIVALYNEAFSGIEWLRTPSLRNSADEATTSWHLYSVQIDFRALARTRARVIADLAAKGVGSQVLYIPVYLQPWYRRTYGYAPGKCPVSEQFYSKALSLPLYPSLSDDDVARVISAVRALPSAS